MTGIDNFVDRKKTSSLDGLLVCADYLVKVDATDRWRGIGFVDGNVWLVQKLSQASPGLRLHVDACSGLEPPAHRTH